MSKAHRTISAFVTVAAMCWIANGAAAQGLTAAQRTSLAKAERHEKAGWVYIHVEGEPQERGFQYGYLLSKDIAWSLQAWKKTWEFTSGMDWPWLVATASKMLAGKVDAENLAEIDGIVEGMLAAGVTTSRDEMVTYNAIVELAWYWWPKMKGSYGSEALVAPKQSCSSFIATGQMTKDGRIVLGHNTMWDYQTGDLRVVLDLLPAKGHRILMQTLPGWIHSGTDFFITDAGLVGSETTIGSFSGFDERGVPEFVRFRRAAQDATTLDEWREIMTRGNNGGYANAWLLGDVKTNEIARLELGLKYVRFERTKDGYYTGSNIAEDLKLLRFETTSDPTDIRQSNVARRVRWAQLIDRYAGRIDIEAAKRFVSDHYDVYLEAESAASSRTLCTHAENEGRTATWLPPFSPFGTLDAKVVDANMARQMTFAGRWGAACGTAFNATKFLAAHPQFAWMKDILKSRPSQPWTLLMAGEKR